MLISLEKECWPTSWRQAFGRSWKLPCNCHTSILHMLTRYLPLMEIFVNSLL